MNLETFITYVTLKGFILQQSTDKISAKIKMQRADNVAILRYTKTNEQFKFMGATHGILNGLSVIYMNDHATLQDLAEVFVNGI